MHPWGIRAPSETTGHQAGLRSACVLFKSAGSPTESRAIRSSYSVGRFVVIFSVGVSTDAAHGETPDVPRRSVSADHRTACATLHIHDSLMRSEVSTLALRMSDTSRPGHGHDSRVPYLAEAIPVRVLRHCDGPRRCTAPPPGDGRIAELDCWRMVFAKSEPITGASQPSLTHSWWVVAHSTCLVACPPRALPPPARRSSSLWSALRSGPGERSRSL